MIPLTQLILLQTGYQFLAERNTSSTLIFVLVVLGFVLLLVVGSIIGNRGRRRAATNQHQKYNHYVFKRMARDVGMQKKHVEILEYLIKVGRVMQPFLIFSNAGLLDDVLRKGLYSLEHNPDLSDELRDRQVGLLFEIKQLIERNSKKGIGVKSTNLIKPGQVLTVNPERGGQYHSRVVSNMRAMLACSAPVNQAGQDLRWHRGTRLEVHFWRDADAGYVFQTKVLGYDQIKGEKCVLVQHSKILRREQQRKFRRKELHRPAFFYPILIQTFGSGRRAVRKAVVQHKRSLLGNIMDVSAGGCALNTLTPLKPAELLKIEFELGLGKRIMVFGKVIRTRGLRPRGTMMHIMFTKLSSKHLNQIYSYVYDYSTSGVTPLGSR